MHKASGRVSRDPSVALVAQQPWIQNATLESNILFHSPMNGEWYDRVVWACALEPDLQMLPDGDLTEIGEKGINLSGGQKLRVSLARAVYSRREVYLLDDPLSAVDSHVGKHLFDHVIGPAGILAGKTRLVVTHSISFLDQVDYIYVVNDGRVSEHGTYDQLMTANRDFTEFINLHSKKADGGNGEGDDDDEDDRLDETEKALSKLQMDLLTPRMSAEDGTTLPISGARSHSRSNKGATGEAKNGRLAHDDDVDEDAEKAPLNPAAAAAGKKDGRQKLIQDEKEEVGNVKMSVVKVYLRAVGLCLAILGVALFFTQEAFGMGIKLWLENWSNEHEVKDATATMTPLRTRLLVYAALTACLGAVVVGGSFTVAMGNISASMKLHDGLAENILRSPMSFFDTVPGGRILNRFSKDIDTIDSTIPYTIRGFLGTFVR